MKKVIKLSGKDVKLMVNKIIAESKKKEAPVDPKTKAVAKETPKPKAVVKETVDPKKPGRIIRLTESEMIEFLDKLAARVENSRRRRNLK